jgi:hypothetical protein
MVTTTSASNIPPNAHTPLPVLPNFCVATTSPHPSPPKKENKKYKKVMEERGKL